MRRPAALMLVVAVCLALFGLAGSAHGSSWERIFQRLAIDDTIVEGRAESEQVYRARIDWTITDVDGFSGNFEDTDEVDIAIAGTNLAFTGTKDGLIAYADAHASEIWAAIFGLSPGNAISGVSEAQASSAAVVGNLVPPATPALLKRNWTNDVLANGEYNFLTVDDVEVTGTSGIAAYSHTIFGAPNQIGIAIPYRLLSAEDTLNTDLDAFQPTIFFKRDFFNGQPIFLTWGAAGFFGINHVNSDLFEDGYYFRYGGNTFASVGREIFPWLALFGDFSYEVGKLWMPEGAVDREIRFIAKAMNELPVDHTITAGIRAGFVAIPGWLWGTVQAFRIHALNPPTGVSNDVQTVLMGKLGTQLFNSLYVEAGYKTTFEVEGLDDNTVIFSARAVF